MQGEKTGSSSRRLLIGGGIAAIALMAIGLGVWSFFASPSARQAQDATPTQVQSQVQEHALDANAQGQGAQTFRDCSDCPEMARIPGQNFAVGRHEVTFAQWGACVAAGGCNGYRPVGEDNLPVVHVAWDEVQAYIQWLSQRTGHRYRLPTAAEWEIAARAGSAANYSWGDEEPVCDRSAPNGANFYCGDGALPVGSFQPNAFGLYDMQGNVSEWVEDCSESNCWTRGVRGGGFYDPPPRHLPQAGNLDPQGRSGGLGFRVVMVVGADARSEESATEPEQATAPAPAAGSRQAPAQVQNFPECRECPEMVRIPGQWLAVARTEVTFAQWDACVAAGGCNGYEPSDEGWGRGNRPVINVNWDDAQAYVQWLSQRTGQRYRLPTAAEWQWAARAGTTTHYSWGDEDPVCDRSVRNGANFDRCNNRTLPVGSFQPNAFGLFDMHGNVREWVEDCSVDGCRYRVRAGGSWIDDAFSQRSSNSGMGSPGARFDFGGFRVVRTD